MAVLADGRVVTGGYNGPMLVWDPARSRAGPAELGRHGDSVGAVAVAVLADGRVVTGEYDGRVLVWDPADPAASPAELGRHGGRVESVAVLADGRVVTGGDDKRVLAWDSGRTWHPGRSADLLRDCPGHGTAWLSKVQSGNCPPR